VAVRAGGDQSDGIAITPRGDSYVVTGRFVGTTVFGQGEPNETTLTAAAAGFDIFVAKYDRDGALLWATRAGGGTNFDIGRGIATAPGGESYVAGDFGGTAVFGRGEPNETTLTAAGSRDGFVAKYDDDGALLWATHAGDGGQGIATAHRAESYVTGIFSGTAVFGQGEPNETTLTAAGLSDIFVANYDRDGALLWATRAGGTTNAADVGRSIATTPSGESYVTGNFGGTAVFGQGEPNETTFTAAAALDIFVAKYDRDGALLWATRAGGSSNDLGIDIAITPRGDSYVTGFFGDTAIFGGGRRQRDRAHLCGLASHVRGEVSPLRRPGSLRTAASQGAPVSSGRTSNMRQMSIASRIAVKNHRAKLILESLHAARQVGQDRRPHRAPWPLRGVPAGRGRGAAGVVRRHPAPDRKPAATVAADPGMRLGSDQRRRPSKRGRP
jgi:hypothetical protein